MGFGSPFADISLLPSWCLDIGWFDIGIRGTGRYLRSTLNLRHELVAPEKDLVINPPPIVLTSSDTFIMPDSDPEIRAAVSLDL